MRVPAIVALPLERHDDVVRYASDRTLRDLAPDECGSETRPSLDGHAALNRQAWRMVLLCTAFRPTDPRSDGRIR
ncbi:hypothetical protein [Saccharothrix syringae]|uniref:Uncharacterized protein n=1 Tax=Saccharothrix syringae TaxID=103733 RepID=A0A5Q0GVR8_SACSY|nr:hypothetical protein [Saccharothrix syringae]QFZ18216.1 hypothetical protein EKG83_12620 [Saccharothrix syringae]